MYRVGQKVYVLSGFRENASEDFFIETRKVVKTGKYVTIAVSEEDKDSTSKTRRFIPSAKGDYVDGYSTEDQIRLPRSYESYSVRFEDGKTHLVFTSREDAEAYFYNFSGSVLYTYADPVDFPPQRYR